MLKQNRFMCRLTTVLVFAMGMATVLAGCTTPAPRLDAAHSATPADCPDELRERVRLAASAMAISLRAELAPQSRTGQPDELVARRLLISASPARDAKGVRVLGSALTVYVFGGTFAGSVNASQTGTAPGGTVTPWKPRDVAAERAVEVIPGRLRIEPFLGGSRLHSETLALDVTLLPGGDPADKMIVSLPPLWTPDRHPVSPDALEIALSAHRHLTHFDVVEARATLEVDGVRERGSREIWRCAYETHFTLVDHDSVLPALWDLRIAARPGKPKRWLALFEPAVGPFRALFTSAEAAQGFATWLRATGATRVGRYQLGLFEPDEGKSQSTIPADRDIASKLEPASADDVRNLTVARVGEN